MNQSTCSTCATPLDTARMYCGQRCKDLAKKRPCTVCGEPAWVTRGSTETTHKKCTPLSEHGTVSRYKYGCRCVECKDATTAAHRDYMARRQAASPTHLRCSHDGCTRTRKVSELCAMHLKRKQRAEGTWKPSPSDAWDTPKNLAKYKRRKAMVRGGLVDGDRFIVSDLIERDGSACGICGAPMPGSAYPDPLSASIDHIEPLSRGGQHTMENARAAHLRCNVSRGNRTDVRMSS